MLVVTMAMSTFPLFALAVVASELEAEFGLSKLQLGLLGAVNTGVGGLTAPAAGRFADRLGGRAAMGVVLGGAAVTSLLGAMAQSYLALLGAMALAGIPQGAGNPATNKAIATGIHASARGLVTGIKQSGVQLAVFVSGAALPALTAAFGWRAGLWLAAGVSLAAMAGLSMVRVAPELAVEAAQGAEATQPTRLPPFVYQVAAYGFLMGTVGGGIGRFLPLFAEEKVGFSPQMAGLVFGLSGLVAIPVRIFSGVSLDRGVSARLTMITMAIGAAGSCALLLAAPSVAALLWVAAIVNGCSLGSWNTSANLAMIRELGPSGAGRATGVLLFGFLLGLTVGGPAVGWSIDRFDSYSPAWTAAGVACLAGAVAVALRLTEVRKGTQLSRGGAD